MSSLKSRPAAYAALVLLTLIAYATLTRNDFVGYDDDYYVTQNETVRAGLLLRHGAENLRALVQGEQEQGVAVARELDGTGAQRLPFRMQARLPDDLRVRLSKAVAGAYCVLDGFTSYRVG